MKVDSWFSYIALTRSLLRNDTIWTWPGNRVDPEARGCRKSPRPSIRRRNATVHLLQYPAQKGNRRLATGRELVMQITRAQTVNALWYIML
jgi:hypothetical protein